MFWNLMHLESDKTFRRRLPWVALTCVLVPTIIFLCAFYGAGKGFISPRYLTWPGGMITALAFANGYSPGYGYGVYVLAVVVGVVTAQEYTWRTMQLWLSHGVPRTRLLLAKFATALLAILVITAAFTLVGAIVSLILTFLRGSTIDLSLSTLGHLLLSILRTAYSMLPYAALAFLLAILSRSVAVAIAGVVLFMLAIELPLTVLLPLLGTPFGHIAQFLPTNLGQALNAQNYIGANLGVENLLTAGHTGVWAAVVGAAIYTLLLLGLTLRVFQRQDLTN